MMFELYGLPITILRLTMTYGPGQKSYKVILRSLIRGKTARLGGGTRAVDWVYVDDAIERAPTSGRGASYSTLNQSISVVAA